MAPGYPLALDLSGRRVLVVGGGAVGSRRALALADAGALVHVVAPEVRPELSGDPRITVRLRVYESSDVGQAWLVHTATGDPSVDAQVAADAQAARVWCVRADSAADSPAWVPAVARLDDVVVAVSAGGDPGRAAALRDAVAALLGSGELPLRRRRSSGRVGQVTLVGGGPGDPGLITLRGMRALAAADVVVVDRLAPRELLDRLGPGVEVVEAGKARHQHLLTQDEINAVIAGRALEGKRVVRLKGGDPYLFGRGGEEVLACRRAGVPVEVVPGVSSAFSGPASAGIPVTHRGVARQVTVLSGHEPADWATLARLEGTLVLLMGVTSLRENLAALVEHGRDPDQPAAIVERATLIDQRVTFATVATLADEAERVGAQAPAVVVVGDVVGLAK